MRGRCGENGQGSKSHIGLSRARPISYKRRNMESIKEMSTFSLVCKWCPRIAESKRPFPRKVWRKFLSVLYPIRYKRCFLDKHVSHTYKTRTNKHTERMRGWYYHVPVPTPKTMGYKNACAFFFFFKYMCFYFLSLLKVVIKLPLNQLKSLTNPNETIRLRWKTSYVCIYPTKRRLWS